MLVEIIHVLHLGCEVGLEVGTSIGTVTQRTKKASVAKNAKHQAERTKQLPYHADDEVDALAIYLRLVRIHVR